MEGGFLGCEDNALQGGQDIRRDGNGAPGAGWRGGEWPGSDGCSVACIGRRLKGATQVQSRWALWRRGAGSVQEVRLEPMREKENKERFTGRNQRI